MRYAGLRGWLRYWRDRRRERDCVPDHAWGDWGPSDVPSALTMRECGHCHHREYV